MENTIKILLMIFFFMFSYVNSVVISSIPSQSIFVTQTATNNYTSIENTEIESYIVLPSNNSDNNSSSNINGVANFNYSQKLNFNKNDYKNFDCYNITHLFETEVNPNAP